MVGLTAKQSPEYIKDEHNFRDLKALLVFCAMHKSLGLDKAGGEGKYLLLNRKFKLYASCVLVLLLLPGQQILSDTYQMTREQQPLIGLEHNS